MAAEKHTLCFWNRIRVVTEQERSRIVTQPDPVDIKCYTAIKACREEAVVVHRVYSYANNAVRL